MAAITFTKAQQAAIDAQVQAAVQATLAAVQAQATPEKPARVSPPRPWDMKGRNLTKARTFTHSTKATATKPSRTGTYKALTFAEAVEAMEAAYEAGFAYCVSVPKP